MEVILKENYPSLGYLGDKVKVKPGFARNFLIPRGLALEATKRNEHALKHALQAINAKRARLKSEAQELHTKLNSAKLEFALKIGQDGRAFGSITAKEIDKALVDQGFKIDRRQIRVLDPIKKVGKHKIEIKLHAEVVAPLEVTVIEESKPQAVKEVDEEKKERKRASKIKKDAVTKEKQAKKEAKTAGAETPAAEAVDSAEGEKKEAAVPKAKKAKAKKSSEAAE